MLPGAESCAGGLRAALWSGDASMLADGLFCWLKKWFLGEAPGLLAFAGVPETGGGGPGTRPRAASVALRALSVSFSSGLRS